MPRTRPKYAPEPEPQQQASVSFVGLPYSLNLRAASAYSDLSQGAIRTAVQSGELQVVKDKPITVLRSDLEAWIKSQRHRYETPVLKKRKSA